MSLLTARGLTVSYGALLVLHQVDLAVEAGDRIAVVGPNGVGKSTLLLVLAGIVRVFRDMRKGIYDEAALEAQLQEIRALPEWEPGAR